MLHHKVAEKEFPFKTDEKEVPIQKYKREEKNTSTASNKTCFSPLGDHQYQEKVWNGDVKFAYAWYVTSKQYLCSAIVALKTLKLARGQTETPGNVDFVLLISKAHGLEANGAHMINNWNELGGVVKYFNESLDFHLTSDYYKSCYNKFLSFLLFDYDRVVYMDADGLPLRSMDNLFHIQFPPGVEMAAPQAYWLNNNGIVDVDHHGISQCPSKCNLALFYR